MLSLQTNVQLNAFNTLKFNSIASNYIQLDDINQLTSLKKITEGFNAYFILGGGSNLILPEQYNGLIIHNLLKGIKFVDCHEFVQVTAMAGENWDNFVLTTLNYGINGLENLSLIPGKVGASPVQNIGAYGVEVRDFIEYVTVFDLLEGKLSQLTKQECNFSYRNSIFKQVHNYLVVSVTFLLPKKINLNCNYGDIKTQLSSLENPTPFDLRNIIIQTRQSKLPDPAIIGNVGSFFHNPILPEEKVLQLLNQFSKLPVYKTEVVNKMKISAGWLIDNIGLKGFSRGNFSVYDKQALVLVHNGGGNKIELLRFANFIQQQVLEHYGVQLHIEPIIL